MQQLDVCLIRHPDAMTLAALVFQQFVVSDPCHCCTTSCATFAHWPDLTAYMTGAAAGGLAAHQAAGLAGPLDQHAKLEGEQALQISLCNQPRTLIQISL
jgi:hypothetical protein